MIIPNGTGSAGIKITVMPKPTKPSQSKAKNKASGSVAKRKKVIGWMGRKNLHVVGLQKKKSEERERNGMKAQRVMGVDPSESDTMYRSRTINNKYTGHCLEFVCYE